MIDGEWVFRKGEHLRLDEGAVTATAHAELRRLLQRLN
jgi:hypothetical protein